jgi:hypothetical protein
LHSGVSGGVISPLTEPDLVSGPILDARLNSGTPSGHPEAYVQVDFFNPLPAPPSGFDLGNVGLQLFMPQPLQPLLPASWSWRFRGDNLCAWEPGLRRQTGLGEIVIDPDIGRLVIGLGTSAQAGELMAPAGAGFASRMFAAFTYGAVGPVGAHPVSRRTPVASGGPAPDIRRVGDVVGGTTLQAALAGLETATAPVLIEIHDSLVHSLDIAAIPNTAIDGGSSLRLAHDLTIHAMGENRPIILLARPLAFRPVVASNATPVTPAVRLEGLYLATDPAAPFPPGQALIARAAVARLEISGCTLAPGGHKRRDGSRAAAQPGIRFANGYGFSAPADEQAFVPTPDIVIQRSVTGSLAIDDRYRLDIESSIVDAAGSGAPAIAAATNPATAWAAALDFDALTCFGVVRTSEANGLGGIFTGRFEVLDNQHGCVKWSAFDGDPLNRLPPNHFCVHAPGARIVFTSVHFNDPGYGQLARETDRRVRELGPGDDAMGAFGFLFEAHKWTNLQVRLREFMPVGVRALSIPVT